MALPLFSQIPTQVLSKLGKENIKKNPSNAKFYADIIQEEKEPNTESEEEQISNDKSTIQTIDINDDSTIIDGEDSYDKPLKKKKLAHEYPTSSTDKTFSDAMVQTDDLDLFKRDACVQTMESSINKLRKSDYDLHRDQSNTHFGDTYKPIYSLPKRQGENAPPLKIGLTLRGRKRKVYYPGLEEDNE